MCKFVYMFVCECVLGGGDFQMKYVASFKFETLGLLLLFM